MLLGQVAFRKGEQAVPQNQLFFFGLLLNPKNAASTLGVQLQQDIQQFASSIHP
jgi:hypothetical protein